MNRNDHISAYAGGGIMGGPVVGSWDNMVSGLALKDVSEEEFGQIAALAGRIEKQEFTLSDEKTGDYSYYVIIRPQGKPEITIYDSGYRAQIPQEVIDLSLIVETGIQKASKPSIEEPGLKK